MNLHLNRISVKGVLRFGVSILVMLSFVNIKAQTTGKITGTIRSAKDNTPLPGADVMVENTFLGASASRSGIFLIEKVPAGVYSLRISMMGYKTERIKSVRVIAGKTTRVNVLLREDVVQMDPVVVIASKQSQELLKSPVSVAVIQSKEIVRRGVVDVVGAVSEIPGALFVGNQVNLRGSSGFSYGAGTRVMFLIDGVPVHASDSGEINWDLVPLIDIDHIEVIKAAGSFLYGGNALGGVINIVTKKPTAKTRVAYNVNWGVYDRPAYKQWEWTTRNHYYDERGLHYNRQDLSFSKQVGKLGIRLTASRYVSTGYMMVGFFHRMTFTGKFHFAFTPNTGLTLFSTYMRDNRGEPVMWRDQAHVFLPMDAEMETNRIHVKNGTMYAKLRHVFSPKFTGSFRISLNDILLGNQYSRPGEFFPAVGPGMEASFDWIPAEKHAFLFGMEYKIDQGKNKWIGEHKGVNIGPYFQYQWQPLPLVKVTSGLRLDSYKLDQRKAEVQLSPRLAVNLLPSANVAFRASAGRGYRVPTIIERFLTLSLAGFEVMPNPKLKSERSWSYEIGGRANLTKNWYVDLAVFQNDFWDMIEPTIDITSNSIQFLNISRPRIRGLEFTSEGRWWHNHLGLDVSFTLMDHKDLVTGKRLFYRPRRIATVIPSLRFWKSELQAEFDYSSRVDRVQVFPLDERVPRKVWNIRWVQRIPRKKLTFVFEVNNLFNYNYTMRERYLEPIRNFRIGMTGYF